MKISTGKISYSITIITLCSVSFSPKIGIGQLELTIDDIIIPIFGLFLLFGNSKFKKIDNQIIRYFTYYLIFLIFSTFYGYFSFNIEPRINDLFELVRLFKYIFIILIVQQSNEKFFIEKFEKWMIICTVVLISISFIEFYNFLDLRSLLYRIFGNNVQKYIGLGDYRNVGSSGNPNDFSSILIIFYLFILQNILDNSKRSVYYIYLFLLIHSISLTGSRTGFMALIIGTLYLIVFSNRTSRIKKIVLYSFFFILVFSAISNLTYLKLGITQFFEGENTSMNARYLIWENIMNYIMQSPWFGYGTSKEFIANNQLLADNEYLLIIMKTGVIGLVIYLYNYIKVMKFLNERHTNNYKIYFTNFINSVFLISFIYMYTSSWFYGYKPFVLFILLYSISIKYYSNKNMNYEN